MTDENVTGSIEKSMKKHAEEARHLAVELGNLVLKTEIINFAVFEFAYDIDAGGTKEELKEKIFSHCDFMLGFGLFLEEMLKPIKDSSDFLQGFVNMQELTQARQGREDCVSKGGVE